VTRPPPRDVPACVPVPRAPAPCVRAPPRPSARLRALRSVPAARRAGSAAGVRPLGLRRRRLPHPAAL